MNNGTAKNKTKADQRLSTTSSPSVSEIIKIEDDSSETEPQKSKEITTHKNPEDKACQTDPYDITEKLTKIVEQRIREYELAAFKNVFPSKNFPLLTRLQKENDEIKKQLKTLKQHQSQKRTTDLAENSSKKARHPETSPIASKPSDAAGISPLAAGVRPNMYVQRPGGIRYQLPPQSMAGHRPPVQMVSPLQQLPPNQRLQFVQRSAAPGAPQNNEYIIIANNGLPQDPFNTRLVAANSNNLRMAMSGPRIPNMVINNRHPASWHGVTPLQAQQAMQAHQAMQTRLPPPNNKDLQKQQQIQQQQIQQQQQQNQQLQQQNQQIQQPLPQLAKPPSNLPKLKASISTSENGIILTWDYDMQSCSSDISQYKVECYQLFAYQAKDNSGIPPTNMAKWKKIGVVTALPLPMACTLTQFSAGNVYHFAVVPVDVHGREGMLSNPCVIRLNLNNG